MRVLACLVFIALAYATEGAPSLSPRIVGGNDAPSDAPIGKYPHQVAIKFEGMFICVGSIIDNNNILTTGFCVERFGGEVARITIHCGTNFLNESGDVYEVKSVTFNKDYDRENRINDIALIHLESPIKFNKLVQPIALSTETDEDLAGKPCMISYWGTAEAGGKTSNSLQEIELIVYPQKDCAKISSPFLKEFHICTLSKVGKRLCIGDSGGPLIANGAQIGLVSMIFCLPGHPDINTRVLSFISWINNNKQN